MLSIKNNINATYELFVEFLCRRESYSDYMNNIRVSGKTRHITAEKYIKGVLNEHAENIIDYSFYWASAQEPNDLSLGFRKQLWADLNKEWRKIYQNWESEVLNEY